MPVPGRIPFYENWTFWAVLIAAAALILSQLPPVRMLLRKAKLDVDLWSRIFLTHKVGNPNVRAFIIIRNASGRNIKISGIHIVLKRDNQEIARLPAQNYVKNIDDKTPVIITPFYIAPNNEWGHWTTFLEFFSREEEKNYRIAESDLRKQIFAKKLLPENKDKIVEVEDKYVEPFKDMFKYFFIWNPGEYEMQLSIETVPKKATLKLNYRFILFESDTSELISMQDGYKTGDGISWESEIKGSIIRISKS